MKIHRFFKIKASCWRSLTIRHFIWSAERRHCASRSSLPCTKLGKHGGRAYALESLSSHRIQLQQSLPKGETNATGSLTLLNWLTEATKGLTVASCQQWNVYKQAGAVSSPPPPWEHRAKCHPCSAALTASDGLPLASVFVRSYVSSKLSDPRVKTAERIWVKVVSMSGHRWPDSLLPDELDTFATLGIARRWRKLNSHASSYLAARQQPDPCL